MQIHIEEIGDNQPSMDVTSPEHLQILIREDGKTIWINSSTRCIFRASKIGELSVDDQRPSKSKHL